MERPRPPLPRLLAAAVLVECCVRLCPALGSRTGSTLSAADPCAHLGTAAGERCQTGHLERGAGTGQAPTPEAMGQLWTEAELLSLPGTPAGTVELSSPQESPRGPGLGREGTGPTVQGATTTEPLGPLVSAGTPEQAAAGREQPSPASLGVTSAGAPAAVQAGTDPATMHPLGTDAVGHVAVEGATTAQGALSHSPPSATVPDSARGQWRSTSTLLGWRATGTALVQSQRATLQLGDSSPGTHPSTVLATDSSAPGTTGTSPFAGGLRRLLTPTGTLQGTHWGLPGLSGGQGFASHPWEGSPSAPRPSALSLGPGGDPLASTAWPAVGTGPALLPATHRHSGLPLPTTMASTPGVTSPGQGGALDLTTGVLSPPDRGGPPEHSHIPLSPSAIPGQPPVPVTPGHAMAQGAVTHANLGSPTSPVPTVYPSQCLCSDPAVDPTAFPRDWLGGPEIQPHCGHPPGSPLPRDAPFQLRGGSC
ncbi:nascent polypeptide-associated complex subunit alpha, muscle-specific form-like [Corvus cornix cornix]|uniref:nascent polypeptide-associated complex subunit alpha, muscle-specific form-like n=1 Tax=Corvus cornix cornix TaxID=932674 RepID=UPI00194FEAF3|nr:nascent polypeptide-associated complex subunit alpha, muscle-specific form-like [Corvus cornix cornix]